MNRLVAVFSCALFMYLNGSGQEICNNGIDDDFDQLIDYNDSLDCTCDGFIDFSMPNLIENASFELNSKCPGFFAESDSILSWFQSNSVDYYHNCGFNDPTPTFSNPAPFTDGDGIVGIWNVFSSPSVRKEYISTCLNAPLMAGEEYIFSLWVNFSTSQTAGVAADFELTIFGATNCSSLPINTSSVIACPSAINSDWQIVHTENLVYQSGWNEYVFEFIPNADFTAISIGPNCAVPSSAEDGYYFLDDLKLIKKETSSKVSIVKNGSTCLDNVVLQAQADTNLALQWYENGLALVGQENMSFTPAEYNGEQEYQVRLGTDSSCGLSNGLFTSQDSISFLLDKQGATCFDSSNGSLEITVTHGAAPYQYLVGSNFQNTPLFNNLSATNYLVIVNDSLGCKDTQNIEINRPEKLMISTSSVLCIDSTEGSITSQAQGGNMPYQFFWNNSSTPSDTFVYQLTGTSSQVDLYAQDSNACLSDTLTIDLLLNPKSDFNLSDTLGCKPLCISTELIEDSLSSISIYRWNFDQNVINDSNITHCFQDTGTFDVTLISIATNSCTDTLTKQLVILPIPRAAFSVEPSNEITGLSSVYFQNSSEFADSFLWSYEGLNSTQESLSHQFNNYATYTIGLKAISSAGCADSTTQNLTVKDFAKIYIPTAFTPSSIQFNNTDTMNNNFKVVHRLKNISQEKIEIFNRWGGLVFQANKIDAPWNGKYQGVEQPSGIYLLKVSYIDNNLFQVKEIHRKVVLIR